MAERVVPRVHQRWAQLRFSVIGQLLAAPPAQGELRAALEQLAAREWRHPSTGLPVRFSVSTLERWFYRARGARMDPIGALRRKPRHDVGTQTSMTPPVRQTLLAQYNAQKAGAPSCTTTICALWPRPEPSYDPYRPIRRCDAFCRPMA